MNTITLELLATLDAIERRGSFAAAAEELGKVPSALSYSIQKYEELLGVTLFVRQGRRSLFTPAGRHLLDQGRQLLAAADSLSEEVQTLASGWEPRLKIAVDALMPVAQVMAVINRFLADKPGVEIDICEEVLGGAWEALIDDRVQLAIGAPAPKPSGQGIRAEPLGVLERVFAVAADHPLMRLPQPLRETDISQHRLVIVHDSSRTGIPRATRLLNLDRHFYVQTIPQKLEAQRAGIGVGFLPRRMVEPLVAAGEMAVLEVAEVNLEDHLFLAWKVANRGQGLKLLTRLLLETDFRFD